MTAEALCNVLFGPGRSILDDLLQNIRIASHKIDVAMFWFNYKPIADALIEARRRGVQVKVIVDKRSLLGMCDQNGDKCLISAPEYLAENGVPIKVYSGPDDIMHHKIVLFDEQCVVASSMNWTYEDLNYNLDHYLVTQHRALSKHVSHWFKRFWERPDMRSITINDIDGSVNNTPIASIHFSDEEPIRVIIEKHINSAEHTVNIMHFMINASWLLKALENTIGRGVAVKIISDKGSTPFLLQASSLGALAKVLAPNGIKKLHHKTIIVDDRITMVGSVNLFDRSLQIDKEHLFVFNSEEVVGKFRSEFDRIWNHDQVETIRSQKLRTQRSPILPIMRRHVNKIMTRPRLVVAALAVLMCLSLMFNLFLLIYILVFNQ